MRIRETASEFAVEIGYLTAAFFVRNAVVLLALSAFGLLSLSFS